VYASFLPAEAVARLFGTVNSLPNAAPSLNVAPTQSAMVVRLHPEKQASAASRHLSVFAGGLMLEAAVTVAASTEITLVGRRRSWRDLAQKSKIACHDVGGPEARFRLLETTRDDALENDALEKLTEIGIPDQTLRQKRCRLRLLVGDQRSRTAATKGASGDSCCPRVHGK
jgi:hypothetical protein